MLPTWSQVVLATWQDSLSAQSCREHVTHGKLVPKRKRGRDEPSILGGPLQFSNHVNDCIPRRGEGPGVYWREGTPCLCSHENQRRRGTSLSTEIKMVKKERIQANGLLGIEKLSLKVKAQKQVSFYGWKWQKIQETETWRLSRRVNKSTANWAGPLGAGDTRGLTLPILHFSQSAQIPCWWYLSGSLLVPSPPPPFSWLNVGDSKAW